MSSTEKMFYTNYGMKVANALFQYLDPVEMFELNTKSESDVESYVELDVEPDVETNVIHDFRITYQKKRVTYISMDHDGIQVNNLIPEKLMRTCRYRKNSKISQAYTKKYEKICSNIYKKIKKNEKYSEMSLKLKDKIIYKPVCELVHTTIGKTRKCAGNLYSHFFSESDRMVLKLYKNRFKIYDFGIDTGKITSHNMTIMSSNQINITFSNGAIFQLKLHTNSYNVKKHISLKYRVKFTNIDEIFSVYASSI